MITQNKMELKYNLIIYFIRCVINYIKSYILTFIILPVIFAIFVTIVNFYSIDVINYGVRLLFKFNLLAPNTNNINEAMAMDIVFKISLVLFIVSEILRYALLKLISQRIIIKIRYKILIQLSIIFIIFALALLSLSQAELSNRNDFKSMTLVLILFGLVSSITTLVYFAVDPLVSFIKNMLGFNLKRY